MSRMYPTLEGFSDPQELKTNSFLQTLPYDYKESENAKSARLDWQLKADQIAETNLTSWPLAIAELIGHNPAFVDDQLNFLKSKVQDACNEIDSLLPKLRYFTSTLKYCATGLEHFYWRAALKAIMYSIYGGRTHSTYFILDGCVKWCERRIPACLEKPCRPQQLSEKLRAAQRELINLRDEIDDHSQGFVRGLAGIHDLMGDDAVKHSDEIAQIARALNDSAWNSNLLINAKRCLQKIENVTP